jgi:AcrR family transcriptional regulator
MVTRQQQLETTREALIDAGLRLADQVGLSAMSVNAIVELAGVSKGSFFHHFGDRAAYLVALHRGFHERLVRDMLAAVGAQPPGRDRLLTAAATYMDACLEHRGVRALLLEARAEPAIASEVVTRNGQMAELCEPDFTAMGWDRPRESARLWPGLVAEAALVEFAAGGRRPAVRTALGQYLGTGREKEGPDA